MELSEVVANLDSTLVRLASDLKRLEDRLNEVTDEVSDVRTILKGPPPEEEGGLYMRLRSVEETIKEIKLIKWGVIALICMKSPDLLALLKPLLH